MYVMMSDDQKCGALMEFIVKLKAWWPAKLSLLQCTNLACHYGDLHEDGKSW
jgi:hypothetical protein